MAISILFSSLVYSQNELDSLLRVYPLQPDSLKTKTLIRIAVHLKKDNAEKANNYLFEALQIATTYHDYAEMGDLNLRIAINEKNLGNLNASEPYYNEALRLAKKVSDTSLMSLSLNGLGIVYKKRGNFQKAVNYYNQAAELLEYKSDESSKRLQAVFYNNLGNLAKNNEDYKASLKYHIKAIQLRKEIGHQSHLAQSYQNIANTYNRLGERDSALMYYNKSLEIFLDPEYTHPISLANLYVSMGTFYQVMGQTDQAESYAHKGLEIFKNIDDKVGIAESYSILASILSDKGKHDKAIDLGLKAYEINKKTGSYLSTKSIVSTLVDVHKNAGDYKKALDFMEELQTIKDSIFQIEKLKSLAQVESQFEVKLLEEQAEIRVKAEEAEKQKLQAEIEKREAEIAKREIEKDASNKLVWSLAIGVLLAIVALFFVYRANLQKKRINQQLERQKKEILIKNMSLEKANTEISHQSDIISQKNKDITDSINYAKKIQTSALPAAWQLNDYFTGSFVLYQPKDIISGDFYWFTHVNDVTVIAVADCTGHGVPGALMSMASLNILNQIVRDKTINAPSDALKLLDTGIYEALSVTEHSETKDGLDIALCAYNHKTRILQFASAYRPMIYCSGEILHSIKGSRHSIGGHLNLDKSFEDHEIQLKEGDRIFLYTDGYPDQFGGPAGKKFKNKTIRKMIRENGRLSMEQQGAKYSLIFEQWKGDMEQIDDMCFVGFEV